MTSSPAPARPVRRPRTTIAIWVVGVTLLSLLPLLLFSAVVVHRQISAEQDRIRAALQRRAALAATVIAQELASVQGELRTVGMGLAAQEGNVASLYDVARRLMLVDPRLEAISLTDEDGHQWFHTGHPFGVPKPDFPPRAHEVRVNDLEEDVARISPLAEGIVAGRPVFAIVTPITLPGQGRMALRAFMRLDVINERLNGQHWPQGWVAGVLDQNLTIIARSRDADRFVGQPATESVQKAIREGRTIFEATTKNLGEAVVAVAPVPGVDWLVAAARPLGTFDAQVSDSLTMLLLAGGVCALLGVTGAAFFSHHLGRQLRAVVDVHARGDAAVARPSRIREVADLAEALMQARESAADARQESIGRLEERSEMLDVLAHEVRQPLNNASAALQGASAALGQGDDPSVGDAVDRAERVLSEVRASIDNTLAVASLLVAGEPVWQRDSDIDSLVAVTIGDLPPGEAGRVHVERATTTRTASMDTGLMRLALRNLLCNALKAGPPGSPVTVRISDSDEPLALLIDVIDRGPGIDPEVMPRLFHRPDRRMKRPSGKRQGLGLYIVRRVMELHRGSVQVKSTGPGGTTMRLVIEQSLDDE